MPNMHDGRKNTSATCDATRIGQDSVHRKVKSLTMLLNAEMVADVPDATMNKTTSVRRAAKRSASRPPT